MKSRAGRRRAKVSITVDPELLVAVDRYVQQRAGLDRSKVMESALTDWYRAREEEATIEQFSADNLVDEAELRDWRKIRRAAATRRFSRPAR